MSYTVSPYLVSIDELKKAIGGKDRAWGIAVLKKRAKENGEPFDEGEWDKPAREDDEEDEWNTVAAVKALVNGNLKSKKIKGYQYGYALEAICQYLGKRDGVEALESIRGTSGGTDYWEEWIFAEKPLVPFNGFNDGDFPIIDYLHLADIPAKVQRTKELDFGKVWKKVNQVISQHSKVQLDMEWAVFSADYETATVSPADFPWLAESYYDSVQQELEALGFSKVRDAEHLPNSRVSPETRNFCRVLINVERNIGVAINQVRVVKPQNDEQRNVDVRCVEFTSEFSDGTFLITANTLGINNLENVEGIMVLNLLPDTPLNEVLDTH